MYWRRRRDLVPIFLAAVPMAFAAVQSYGGELFLRIVLYGLPIMAILGADALRALVRKRRSLEWVLAVGMVVLMGLLVVIRGGNDSFQVVFPQEVTMYRQVVAETPPGQTISALSRLGPAGVVGINDHPLGDNPKGCGQLAADPAALHRGGEPRRRRVLHLGGEGRRVPQRPEAGLVARRRCRRSSPRAATRSPTRTATTGSSGRSSPQRERVAEP